MGRTTALLVLVPLLGCRAPSSPGVQSPATPIVAAPAPTPAAEPGSDVEVVEQPEPPAEPEPSEPPAEPEPSEPPAQPEPAASTTPNGDGKIGLGNSCKIAACGKKRRWKTNVRMTLLLDGDGPVTELRRIILAHDAGFHNCYQDALDEDPRLAGTVELRFGLTPVAPGAPSPRAHSIEGTSATGPGLAGVERCVRNRLRFVNFPKMLVRNKIGVTVRFKLSPDGRGPQR